MPKEKNMVLIQVDHLVKYYLLSEGNLLARKTRTVHAVDDVSLVIHKGEILGLIGDTGSGKTTLAKTILQIEEPTSGSVSINKVDVVSQNGESMRPLQSQARMVHQIPDATLNLKKTVEFSIYESFPVYGLKDPREIQARVQETMYALGFHPAYANVPLGELTDGQRQVLAIAEALVASPLFVVWDEPLSHLDGSTRARVLNLIEQKRRETEMSSLFICSDLPVLRRISDRIAVMYLGRIIEQAEREEFYARPLHPFSRMLVSAAPVPSPSAEQRRKWLAMGGDYPSNLKPPPGCRFRLSCPLAEEICAEQTPELRDVGSDHWVACHLV